MPNIIPVSDPDMPELKIYACRTEIPLKHCFEPEPGVFVAETPKVIERALDAGYEPLSFLAETRYIREWMDDCRDPRLGRVESSGCENADGPGISADSGSSDGPGISDDPGISDGDENLNGLRNTAESGEMEKAEEHAESGKMEKTEEHAAPISHGDHVKKVIARCAGVPVYTADQQFLRKLLGYPLPGGLLCAMRRRILPSADEICRDAKRIVILESVTNPTNVGTIFRSAAALDMDAVLLTPSCSDPLYRRTERVSMGTVFQVPWTYFDKKTSWPEEAYAKLKSRGFKTAAMVLRKDSIGIDDASLLSEDKLAIVLGSEGEGLARETIDECDYKVCIPMAHGVDSLNVAEAATIAFWELGRKR